MPKALGVALSGIALTVFAVVLALAQNSGIAILIGLAGVLLTIAAGSVMERS